MPIVLCSGGFDPLHDGHVEYIEKASRYGEVIVALNSDAWLVRKKGSAFISWERRRKIMLGLKGVIGVYPVKDEDGTVCEAIRELKPDYFAKGGDRLRQNTPEAQLCDGLGIQLLFGLGEKVNSSSEIVNRQWGAFEVLYESPSFKVKRLSVLPGKSTSLQRHEKRAEAWIYPDGKVQVVPAGVWHQLRNKDCTPLDVIEVQTGTYFGEDDIERA